jgi:ammonia channel protein AmtB
VIIYGYILYIHITQKRKDEKMTYNRFQKIVNKNTDDVLRVFKIIHQTAVQLVHPVIVLVTLFVVTAVVALCVAMMYGIRKISRFFNKTEESKPFLTDTPPEGEIVDEE